MGQRGAQALSESPYLSSLATLYFDSNDIGEAGVESLLFPQRLRGLRSLRIRDHDAIMAESDYARWAAGDEINDTTGNGFLILSLSHVPVKDNCAQLIAESKRFAPLRLLGLNGLSDAGLKFLAESPSLRRLTWLSLKSKSGFDPASMKKLSGSLILAGVKYLNLSDNSIGDEGVPALAASPYLAGLERLEHNANAISDVGLEALAASSGIAQLAYLSLSRNRIGDRGLAALANSPNLAKLKGLYLDQNAITDDGLRALIATPYLKDLEFLVIRDNPTDGLRVDEAYDYGGFLNYVGTTAPMAERLKRRFPKTRI